MTTLAEIEKAIEQLPQEDYAKLVAWLKERSNQEVQYVDDETFQKIADKVFKQHAPLLAKLAQ